MLSMQDAKLSFTECGRLYGIDALRGLSALLVVLHHIHLRFKLNKFDVAGLFPEPVMQLLFWSGYYGVIFFFVISGFLITRLSISRWGSLDQPLIKQFYLLRIARIAPCLSLLLAVLSVLHSLAAAGFAINPERVTLARAVFAALTFHLNWLEGHHGYLPGNWDVLWSLSVEETFYVLFPLVCWLVRSERMFVVLLVCLIVYAPFNRVALGGQDAWEEYAYLSCMDGIAMGCIAALTAGRTQFKPHTLKCLLWAGGVICVMSLLLREQATALHAVGMDLTVLEAGVALLLIALANGAGAKLLSKGTGLIRLIGRCSYEIYLTHMFVVLGLMNLIKGTQLSSAMILLWYSIMLLLSLVLGHLTFHYYSEPMNRLLRQRFTGGHQKES
jgi:peptidoglycan/LPS O-acetylase OafA/YrhL